MKHYDIGIGWTHPADQIFVKLLKKHLRNQKRSFLELTFENLEEDFLRIQKSELSFDAFICQSLEDHPAYPIISYILKQRGTKIFPDPDSVIAFGSKAKLHALFEKEQLPLPPTAILSQKNPPEKEYGAFIQALGIPFVLKPAHGGGGDYVSLTGRTATDIKEAVRDNAPDHTLMQKLLAPATLGNRIAWFRPIFVQGLIIPLWWDPRNHFYKEFGNTKQEKEIATKLIFFVERIAKLTKLHLFSIEVMVDTKGKYTIIDYLNHPIDLNTQDRTPDALPAGIVEAVAAKLAQSIA